MLTNHLLPSRRTLLYFLVCYLLLFPKVAQAGQPAIRVGLQTLPGPWTVIGPASISLHTNEFKTETIELSAGVKAVIGDGPEQFILTAGPSRQQAEFIAAMLRGCSVYASILRRGADFLLALPVERSKAAELIARGLPLHTGSGSSGLHLQIVDRHYAVLSAKVTSTDGTVQVNSRHYHGNISFARFGSAQPSAVNTLLLEQYLQGVVPGEMPASWHLPALQAQAVAARTYALKQMWKHRQEGYDLCDTTHCQKYGGADGECENSNLAVRSTSGLILTWQGRLIDAVYHSHAGGHTVSSLHAWDNAVPYLPAQPIPEEPPYIWSLQLTTAELELLLAQRLHVGYIYDLRATLYGEGRRVVSVDLNALIGPKRVSVKDLRLAIGVNRLRSSCFTVTAHSLGGNLIADDKLAGGLLLRSQPQQPVAAELGGCFAGLLPARPAYFEFHGTGYGHGVGMSQWGAFGMANLGYSYKEILYRFYPGAELALGYQTEESSVEF